jgi:type I restriction enzyme, S subunit
LKGWKRTLNTELIASGVLEIGDGYRAKNTELDAYGLPFARAGNINNGFLFDDADLLCHKSVEKARDKISQTNDCVITTKGTFGRVGYVRKGTRRFVYSPQLCYWRSKNYRFLSPQFLFYWLQSAEFLTQAHQIKSSTDMADYANLSDQRSMSISLPPLPIQRKIAAVLSAYDDLIENNTLRIAILEKMAEELYREWFVRLRFPGHEKTKIVKGVPEGWRTPTLSDACDLITRGVSPKYDDNSPYYVINQKCIRNAKIDFSEARRHSSKVPHYKFLKYGDVLINSTGVGTLGRVSAVEYEIAETTCDSHVSICRADIKKASIHFLSFCLKGLQSHFESSSTGATGQTELNRTEIGRTNILLPNKPLQDAFSKAISPIWELKHSLDLALQNLTISRNSLLSRLMSGKIDLEHLDIQFPPSMREVDHAHA